MIGKIANLYSDFIMTKETDYNVNPGYRSHPAIANSDLRYLHSPRLFRANKDQELVEQETGYQRTGSLIDEFLLNNEEFNDKFIQEPVLKDIPTSGHQKNFVEAILQTENPLSLDDEVVYSFHNDLYSTSSLDKAVKMYNEFKPHIRFKLNAEGKQTYSEGDWNQLQEVERNCRKNELINRFLFEPKESDKVMKHLQIIGMPKWGIKWKGELDLAVVNFLDKEIYNIDLKTTSKPISSFAYWYNRYKYYRQQALYRKLLVWHLTEEGIIKEDEFEKWTVKTRVIVVKTTDLYEAYCVPVPYHMIRKGMDELLDAAKKISFYQNNGWDYTKSYHENNGLEVLDFSEFEEEET